MMAVYNVVHKAIAWLWDERSEFIKSYEVVRQLAGTTIFDFMERI